MSKSQNSKKVELIIPLNFLKIKPLQQFKKKSLYTTEEKRDEICIRHTMKIVYKIFTNLFSIKNRVTDNRKKVDVRGESVVWGEHFVINL